MLCYAMQYSFVLLAAITERKMAKEVRDELMNLMKKDKLKLEIPMGEKY